MTLFGPEPQRVIEQFDYHALWAGQPRGEIGHVFDVFLAHWGEAIGIRDIVEATNIRPSVVARLIAVLEKQHQIAGSTYCTVNDVDVKWQLTSNALQGCRRARNEGTHTQ